MKKKSLPLGVWGLHFVKSPLVGNNHRPNSLLFIIFYIFYFYSIIHLICIVNHNNNKESGVQITCYVFSAEQNRTKNSLIIISSSSSSATETTSFEPEKATTLSIFVHEYSGVSRLDTFLKMHWVTTCTFS